MERLARGEEHARRGEGSGGRRGSRRGILREEEVRVKTELVSKTNLSVQGVGKCEARWGACGLDSKLYRPE